MEYNYQTTEGMIEAFKEKRGDKTAEFYEWFMDSIDITENNDVENLPNPEDAPIETDLARELIIAIIFGCDLEHEYPREED